VRIWISSHSLLHAGGQDGETSYLKTPRMSLLFPHPAAHLTGCDDIAPCLDADNTCFELVQYSPISHKHPTLACLRTETLGHTLQPEVMLDFWDVIFYSVIFSYLRFGRTVCLHLQGYQVRRRYNPKETHRFSYSSL
jgi:hypothetical protein